MKEAAMDLQGKVFLENKFRGGHIRVVVGELSESLYWEFGGGNCIAYVEVPNPDKWQESHLFRQFEREMFLSGLAAEICRLECPDAIYEIGSDQIIFLTRPRP
jgi:hypothetical protein